MTYNKTTLKNISKFNQENYKKSMKWEYVNYLDTGNITENKVDNVQLIDLKSDKLPSRARRIPQKNSILYSTVRPNQKHYGFVRENNIPNLLVSTGFIVLDVDKNKADPKYIYYYLIQDSIINMLQNIGETSTSTYPSIKVSDLENLKINLPTIFEQEKIANVLSSFDNKIENNNAIIANLEEQAQAIFKSWFINFEPFQDEEFIDTELGLIPESFNVATFDDFVSISSGKRKKNSEKTADNIYPIIGASKITGYTDDYLFNEKVIITGRVGTLGTLQIYNSKIWPSDNTLILRSDFYAFTYFALKTINFSALNRGSTQPLVSQKDIKNSKVILPNMEWLSKFENILNPIINYYWKIEEENQKLIEIRDTLLPKLMSGEIRVEDTIEVKEM